LLDHRLRSNQIALFPNASTHRINAATIEPPDYCLNSVGWETRPVRFRCRHSRA
jgi:hypothetical protein